MLQKLFQKKDSKPVTTNKQKDYIQYCRSLEQTLSELGSNLHTSDSPEEIAMMAMQTACDFYGADWCGFLEVDLDLGLWTPYWWHNIRPDDKTQDKQPGSEIIEGGGLSTLRRRVERAGGTMTVQSLPKFKLTVTVPKGKEGVL